jgi:hypothetical protein
MTFCQNKKWILAALLGALVLVGCGGGGGGGGSPNTANQQQPAPAASAPTPASAPAPGPAPAPQPKPVTIDAEGDSLIFGYKVVNGVASQSPNNPPDVLQALLRAQLGDGVTVQNNAITGAAAFQSISGIGHYTQPFYQRLAVDDAAQIVLADYAVNDSVERSTTAYQADLTVWVNTVRAAGKTPVLEEPNPTCDAGHPNVGTYVQTMRYVAQTMNVLLIEQYDYVLSLPNWQTMLSADCVHPGDQLYSMKAQREYDALMPLVKSMR